MPVLTREQILQANDLEAVAVHIPEWSGDVRLRPLTAAEAARLASDVERAGKNGNAMSTFNEQIVAMSCVDEEGQALFQMSDVAELTKKSIGPINKIVAKALELSHMTEDAKELVGKSVATIESASSTD